jgi:hypothetical protein
MKSRPMIRPESALSALLAAICAGSASGQVVTAANARPSALIDRDVARWLAGGATALTIEQPDDAGSGGGSSPFGFGVGVVSWSPRLSGDVTLEDSTGFGTELSISGDLGLEELGTNVIWDVHLRLKRHRIGVSGFSLSASEVEVATDSITWGDITIDPGDLFDSEIELDNVKVLYSYSLFTPEKHGFDFGLGAGIDYFRVRTALEDALTLERESFDEHVPLPVLAARLEVPAGPFRLSTEASGFYLRVNDIDAGFLDAAASLSWEPTPGLVIYGGYRIIAPDLNGSDFQADLEIQGPFAGLAIRF